MGADQDGSAFQQPTRPVRNRPHAMLIAASIAIVLFCSAGTAAIMGWIPTSFSANDANDGLPVMTKDAEVRPASQAKPRTVAQAAPQKVACHNCGVVESTREISHRGEASGVGAVGGAVVGGLLGNQVGGGNGKKLMTVAGAVGGAVAGNQIEGRMNSTTSYETVVRLDSGYVRTFTQATRPAWGNGDTVRVVDGALRPVG